jgi:hypothetical protein
MCACGGAIRASPSNSPSRVALPALIQILIIKFARRVAALFAAAPFDFSTAAQAADDVKFVGQHQNAQRNHPEPHYGQKTQYSANDQRPPHKNAQCARLRQFEGAVAYAKIGHDVSCG